MNNYLQLNELNSLRSSRYGGRMLEYWVILSSFTLFRTSSQREGGKLGFWFIRKIHLDMGGNMSKNENSPLKSTFHYSTIPLFNVRGKNIEPRKTL
jgi:hypothetical protein